MWHVSIGNTKHGHETRARLWLRDAGDPELGEWPEWSDDGEVFHLRRRLTLEEISEFDVPNPPIDVRGTDVEHRRIQRLLYEAPWLRA